MTVFCSGPKIATAREIDRLGSRSWLEETRAGSPRPGFSRETRARCEEFFLTFNRNHQSVQNDQGIVISDPSFETKAILTASEIYEVVAIHRALPPEERLALAVPPDEELASIMRSSAFFFREGNILEDFFSNTDNFYLVFAIRKNGKIIGSIAVFKAPELTQQMMLKKPVDKKRIIFLTMAILPEFVEMIPKILKAQLHHIFSDLGASAVIQGTHIGQDSRPLATALEMENNGLPVKPVEFSNTKDAAADDLIPPMKILTADAFRAYLATHPL